jgi:aspartokinase/homoserine dehydrogenase 1
MLDFFKSIVEHAAHFEGILATANEKESRLKFVANLKMVKPALVYTIPKTILYNLEGKDNIVLFFTDRYVDQPLLIKGLVPVLRLPNFCLMI